jgi:hypothetical protein
MTRTPLPPGAPSEGQGLLLYTPLMVPSCLQLLQLTAILWPTAKQVVLLQILPGLC